MRPNLKYYFMRKSIFIGILAVSALLSNRALGQIKVTSFGCDTSAYGSAIGRQTIAFGQYSLAAGYRAQTEKDNSFVFGTGNSKGFLTSPCPNSFLIGFGTKPVFFAQLDTTSSPRVGIGAMDPKTTLDVRGTTKTEKLRVTGPSFQYEKGTNLGFLPVSGVEGGPVPDTPMPTLFLSETGVGVMTDDPQSALDVNGGIRTVAMRLTGSSFNYEKEKNLGFYWMTGGGDMGGTTTIPTLFLSDAGVGIMTKNPTSTLDVNGNVRADTVKIKRSIFLTEDELSFTYYSDGLDPGGNDNEPGDDEPPVDKMGGDSNSGSGTSGVKTIMVLKDNRVGIGITSPQTKLHVSGNGLLSGNLTVGNSSACSASSDFNIKMQIGNAWLFADKSFAKIMGYNCGFLDNGSSGRYVEGNAAAAAVMLNTDGSIQLRTAPYGAKDAPLVWNYLTMLNNGNVGIGTTDPKYPLDVNGSANFDKIYTNIIDFPGTELKIIKTKDNIQTPDKGGETEDDPEEDPKDPEGDPKGDLYTIDIITIKDNGWVGIGTTIPKNKFHVEGNSYLDGRLGIGTSDPEKKLHVQGDSYFSGAVGIGTTKMDEYKLRVDGLINCKEVVVTSDVPKGDAGEWPDYVFADDYTLRSLDEVASYIEQNQRLPEIPSAADVAEKGVSLLEINTLLLKKVEELTLYILQQNEKMTDLQGQIDELKKR